MTGLPVSGIRLVVIENFTIPIYDLKSKDIIESSVPCIKPVFVPFESGNYNLGCGQTKTAGLADSWN